MEPRVRNGKLIQKRIIAAVAAVIAVATMLTVLSGIEINNTYTNMVKEELLLAVTQLESEMTNVWDGDWALIDEQVYKGEENIMAEYEEIMDELKESTGVEYSLFYGNTRMITTLETSGGLKAAGYNVPDSIATAVLNRGETYFAKSVPAGADEEFYSYYMPLKNDDGTIIGMVYSGRETDSVKATIRGIILQMALLSLLISVGVSIVGIVIANKSSGKMRAIADELGLLSQGELKLNIDQSSIDRNDEIGLLADGAKVLSEKLGEVIRTTMDMSAELKESGSSLSESASKASESASNVSEAVGEISKGAASQAESVETAAGNTQSIGKDIEEVSDSINQLNNYADEMRTSCEAAMDALNRLIEQSGEVQESVKDIGATINSTNESAKEISKFSEAITSIASQTNLLSLNASIEAARAGDAGKGFAVVATEIGQLAVQSSQSAEEIKKIVEKLVADSEQSVAVMERLNDSFQQQGEQLDDTKTNMQSMADNVTNVTDSTESIATYIQRLETAKDQLVEIMSDLSAISQENAASSEETSASMQELNETFAVITESATKLQELAGNMSETISYFKP